MRRLFGWLRALIRRRAFGQTQRTDFYRAMYLYQRAGARKLDALEKLRSAYASHLSIRQQLGNKLCRRLGARRDIFIPPIAQIAETALKRSNLTLAEALTEWLPLSERAILAAGESSGNLADAFQMAARFARQQGGMWQHVIGAFGGPLLMVGVMMAMLYIAADSILPAFEVNHSQLSPTAQLVVLAADLVHGYWHVVLGVTLVLVFGIASSLGRWKGRWRTKADRYPPWSIYRRIHGALFLYSYAVLQKAGVPIQTALATLGESANPWLRTRITAAMYGVRQGYNLGQSFRHSGHEFPDWQAIPVLESISSLSGSADALIEYAENWLDDTSRAVERFSRRGKAILQIWLFLWIGLMATATFDIIFIAFK